MTQSKELKNSNEHICETDHLQDLIQENEFLLKIVDTIPAKFYFGSYIQEKIANEKHKKMDFKTKALKRFSDHNEISAKDKHKRACLDPDVQKSVLQIQEGWSKKKSKKKKKLIGSPSSSLKRAANVEELQLRLQERLSQFQTKRKMTSTGSKEKMLRNSEKKMKKNKTKTIKPVNENDMQVKTISKKKETPDKEAKPIYNKDGKIMYSKLDFSENGVEKLDKKKTQFSGKNYKQLLIKAEKKKEKLEKLKETDPEKAISVEEKEKWNRAILKSENIKVKDDPVLLKKSIKKQEKIKKKKADEWKGRIDHTEHKLKARQEKRTKNIEKRKKDKLDKKIKHAKKKGRVIPKF